MDFKIDTKEKFTVFTPDTAHFPANITEDIKLCLQKKVKNAILNLKNVINISTTDVQNVGQLHRQFYNNNSSFVICELNPEVKKQLEAADILDYLNTTPSESEAWDIVQMEEMERELLDEI
ncbi:MAG: STAS domain-containing protein [Chitinophagaceae bacterium]|jgi:anti-anti-sigma regulatory factor|nr:STAS domain-containing protein [Chitinophagaceae bacterium]